MDALVKAVEGESEEEVKGADGREDVAKELAALRERNKQLEEALHKHRAELSRVHNMYKESSGSHESVNERFVKCMLLMRDVIEPASRLRMGDDIDPGEEWARAFKRAVHIACGAKGIAECEASYESLDANARETFHKLVYTTSMVMQRYKELKERLPQEVREKYGII